MKVCDKWRPRQGEIFAAELISPPVFKAGGLCRYFNPPQTCNRPDIFVCETYGRKEFIARESP